MKGKTTSFVGTILLLLLLLVLTPSLIGMKEASAYNAAVLYTSPAAPFDYDEYTLSVNTATTTMSYLMDYGNFQYQYNCYGAQVTSNTMLFLAQYFENNYDFATVYFKDHDVPWKCIPSCPSNWHFALLDSGSPPNNYVYDRSIWYVT